MSTYALDVALIGFLMFLNAVFAGSEMALVALRQSQLQQLEREGSPRALRLTAIGRPPDDTK